MPHALIQLVSEQTLPNVFLALALAPTETILLHTPQTVKQCDWIARALQLAHLETSTRFVPLPDNPDHHATGQAVLEQVSAAREAGLTPVVNITGGTKLMSIGAFAAAHQQRLPACYVDTAHRQILAATNVALPSPLDSSPTAFRRISDQLTVAILAAAHGAESVVSGRDPALWLPTARFLASDPELETATHLFAVDSLDEGRRQPADYARLLATPLDRLPDQIIESLAASGLIAQNEGRWHLWHPEPELFTRWSTGERYDSIQTYFAATAPLQQMIGFLLGGWWELAVLDAARKSGRFHDFQWSAEIIRPGNSTPLEEDLLAVEDLNLAVFSCKRGGDRNRLLRAFEELDSAARYLGGAVARRYLAVAMPLPLHIFSELKARATNSRTALVGPVARLISSLS